MDSKEKKFLEGLADKYQKKADDSYELYQETGMTRYRTAYQRNEDLAGAIRMAASAAEDHEELVAMRANVSNFASRAAMAERKDLSKFEREELINALLRDMAAYGRMKGLIGVTHYEQK